MATSDPRGSPHSSAADRRKKAIDRRKKSLYLPEEILVEVEAEAERQMRSASWIVQRCIRIALPKLKTYPSFSDYAEDEKKK